MHHRNTKPVDYCPVQTPSFINSFICFQTTSQPMSNHGKKRSTRRYNFKLNLRARVFINYFKNKQTVWKKKTNSGLMCCVDTDKKFTQNFHSNFWNAVHVCFKKCHKAAIFRLKLLDLCLNILHFVPKHNCKVSTSFIEEKQIKV